LRKIKQFGKRTGMVAGMIFVLLLIVFSGFRWVTNYVWMDTLNFGEVYLTIFSSKIVLGASGFILFAVVTYFSLWWIRRSYVSHFGPEHLPPGFPGKKVGNWLMLIGAILIGALGSSIVQGIGWEPALKMLKHVSFGKTDPYFGMDVSFYMFVLPFIKFAIYVLLGLSIFFLLLEIGMYSAFNMYRMNRSAQIHMGVTLAFIGLLLAGIHVLAPYDTLLTDNVNIFQKSVVSGLSYTDKLINIPKAYVLAAVAIIAAIWMIIVLVKGKLHAILVPVVMYIAFVILGQGASIITQSFIVSPNEFAKEKPYLEHNLNFTRAAYDLDKIEEKENPGNDTLSEDLIKRNQLTIDNVRLNDSRPLLDVYNQLQTFRTYYKFNGMDIDRYRIDGKYEQVFIGARELSTEDLPSQAQTWVNRTLRYTHGYGVAMSHVNKVTKEGQPEYMMKNIPTEGVLDVKRPQIYFGEEDYPNVVVNSKVDEFDYPTGDENKSSRFEEKSGIPLKGLNKFLFALDEGSFRMLVSDQLTKESQLLATRNIMDRVKRIAPFFQYDDDPYIFVREDGTLAWMMDAYLTGERYPYSEPHAGNENYIKNAVKVVIDAYSGEVNFYVAEPDDPLLQTYQQIFPDLFTTDVPDDIRAHFRYPENLFNIEANMYGTYHMSNLEIFYNREDYWQSPTEKYFDEDIEMEPYYITMTLPDHDEEEFVLMKPYTPKKRQNMISWIGVRNDGEHYGEKVVYRFPKQKNIYGPQQIENRINQDSHISQQMNLWSQGGSKVIRGNLLAIPIEDTVLYVEPIYIESSNKTSLPEVKQVIMAYGEQIVMEETFDQALDKILSVVDPDADASDKDKGKNKEETDQKEGEEETEPILEAQEKLEEISTLFEDYRNAMADGKWEKAGEIMEEIEGKLNDEQ
jgi:uncharacterized membrane protein (UPF0182 family)